MTISSFGYGVPRTDLIVYDDMLGASGDNLNTRASSYGGTPTRSPAAAFASTAIKLDGAGGAYGNNSGGYYWPSASPATGDYTVTGMFNLVTKTNSSTFDLLARLDDTVTNGLGKCYIFRWTNGQFQLYRQWDGASAGGNTLQLGSNVAFTMNAGETHWIRFQATGTSTVTLIADRSTDGQSWTNVFNYAQSTNSPITSAGKPGIWLDESASGSTLTHCQLFLVA